MHNSDGDLGFDIWVLHRSFWLLGDLQIGSLDSGYQVGYFAVIHLLTPLSDVEVLRFGVVDHDSTR